MALARRGREEATARVERTDGRRLALTRARELRIVEVRLAPGPIERDAVDLALRRRAGARLDLDGRFATERRFMLGLRLVADVRFAGARRAEPALETFAAERRFITCVRLPTVARFAVLPRLIEGLRLVAARAAVVARVPVVRRFIEGLRFAVVARTRVTVGRRLAVVGRFAALLRLAVVVRFAGVPEERLTAAARFAVTRRFVEGPRLAVDARFTVALRVEPALETFAAERLVATFRVEVPRVLDELLLGRAVVEAVRRAGIFAGLAAAVRRAAAFRAEAPTCFEALRFARVVVEAVRRAGVFTVEVRRAALFVPDLAPVAFLGPAAVVMRAPAATREILRPPARVLAREVLGAFLLEVLRGAAPALAVRARVDFGAGLLLLDLVAMVFPPVSASSASSTICLARALKPPTPPVEVARRPCLSCVIQTSW